MQQAAALLDVQFTLSGYVRQPRATSGDTQGGAP
jgi:general secretion pathway protein M